MTEFFKKSKQNYFGANLVPPLFKYSSYLPSSQESKKSYWVIPEKNAEMMDGQTDKQTQRQQWFYRPLHNIEIVKPQD